MNEPEREHNSPNASTSGSTTEEVRLLATERKLLSSIREGLHL